MQFNVKIIHTVMHMQKWLLVPFCVCFVIHQCSGYFTPEEDHCFCQLQGKIDDCSCVVDTVDNFNNIKVYPRLKSLLNKDYFRFYKVNLKRACPFWVDDSRCAIRYCHVETCDDSALPSGLKGNVKKTLFMTETGVGKYLKDASCEEDDDHNAELSYLNTTISAKVQEDFALWTAYDEALDNFCAPEDADESAQYVDLLLNPERYTGYRGPSAHRIWNSIYMENCFRPLTHSYQTYIPNELLDNMCLEQRVFYRLISGLHTSINVHLCAKYLQSENNAFGLVSPSGVWGHNVTEFKKKFSPETTDGQGPNWLKNLYFVYLLELRALDKASPYLEKEEFYTGSEAEDWDTQQAVKDLLKVIKSFPNHFDETVMFRDEEHAYLKQEFKNHFRNITRIMDCVGCDKCKLWGKLQTQGLGTALKILFSDRFDSKYMVKDTAKRHFQLQRSEIVSLINSIGRLSTSINELDEFRHMIR